MEIERNGSSLFYERTGNGAEKLLLFHGFGLDHKSFDPLTLSLQNDYSTFSFDLFYHGNSKWNNTGVPILPEDWKTFLDEFITRENADHFSVVGFSIGARFALATMMLYPHRVKRLILLAPDGIGNHPLFSAATSYSLNRQLFRSIMSTPFLIENVLKLGLKVRIVDVATARLALSQTKSDDLRLKIYHCWTVFRKLVFRVKEIARILNQHQIRLYIFVAANDQMSRPRQLKKLAGLASESFIRTINRPHQQLLRSVVVDLQAILRD